MRQEHSGGRKFGSVCGKSCSNLADQMSPISIAPSNPFVGLARRNLGKNFRTSEDQLVGIVGRIESYIVENEF
jgi:hypothetical protein